MISFEKFLETATRPAQTALDEAHAYRYEDGRILEASSVNGVLTDLGLIVPVTDVANDPAHPAREKMLGVYTGLMGNHQFNFIKNTLTGDRALIQLEWLITTGLPEKATQLTQFREIMLWRANVDVFPFINKTLHDVLIGWDECPRSEVQIDKGFALITTLADCPAHRPRLLVKTPLTWQRINSFPTVSAAGSYECLIPPQYRGLTLAVDNAYGVL